MGEESQGAIDLRNSTPILDEEQEKGQQIGSCSDSSRYQVAPTFTSSNR